MSEKKKRVFFTQVVSLSVVISILYSEIIRSLSRGFSLQGERVSTYFCVVVLPLCLLEFIHSNIEFFPTQSWVNKFIFYWSRCASSPPPIRGINNNFNWLLMGNRHVEDCIACEGLCLCERVRR